MKKQNRAPTLHIFGLKMRQKWQTFCQRNGEKRAFITASILITDRSTCASAFQIWLSIFALNYRSRYSLYFRSQKLSIARNRIEFYQRIKHARQYVGDDDYSDFTASHASSNKNTLFILRLLIIERESACARVYVPVRVRQALLL